MESLAGEVWKAVVGYEGAYDVSSLGRIRSWLRTRNPPRLLKTPSNSWGYPVVGLCKDGKPKYTNMHSLVAAAFATRLPHHSEVNHKNGVKTDNRAENLEWVTGEENMNHAVVHCFHRSGERHDRAKITWEQVDEIRRRAADGEPPRRIGMSYGLCKSSIRRIVRGEAWQERTRPVTAKESK